jgi:signal transduction histidine kinase
MARWRGAHAGAAALVAAGLAGYVTAVYAAVVIGGAALAHRLDRPPVALSVVATALVALGFEPVRRRLHPIAIRLAGGGRRAPYELLTGLHPDVVAVDEAPVHMARLLAEATGARSAQVLLTVNGTPTPAAAWPPGGMPGGDRLALPVRHNGATLGELVINVEQPLTPVEERLFRGLAGQAGLVLRAVALRAELAERLRDSTRRAEELRASRERVVAAQDEERRRLERDIHDGAQQHLVAFAVQLRLARTLVARSSDRASGVVAGLPTAAGDAMATLASLSRGIYPRHLADSGVGPALAAVLTPAALPIDGRAAVELVVDDTGRMSPEAERALYFCALEAVQNASKHAKASRVVVRARRLPDAVELVVSDDGIGFAPERSVPGRGLTNIADRAEAIGGALRIASRPGAGTVVTVRIPAGSPG